MFGYVKPFKPELKIREFEAYRAVYCGMCHTLGKRYAFAMRFILSYDLTLMAMLLLSMRESPVTICKCRCPANLRKLPACTQGRELRFVADCGVLLLYHKLRDNLHDASIPKKVLAALLLPIAACMKRRAASRQPQAAARIADAMRAQADAESKGAGIDAAADPTSGMIGDLLLLGAEKQADERVLHRFGYFLGRWIYLIDAVDDMQQDTQSGDFNPFALAWHLSPTSDFVAARARTVGLLNSCVYEMQAALALLPVRQYAEVLENTFSLGLPHMQCAVVEGLPNKSR
ncbi:DUF5685 family protein [Ethanoligenens sp.]|uniref:DUF5685 family protein n=1 Tax=Ethanoligenens sp. TaxID=2099655 RepID=UPI0039E92568